MSREQTHVQAQCRSIVDGVFDLRKRIEGALAVTLSLTWGRLKLRTLGVATYGRPEMLEIKRGKTDRTVDLVFPAGLQIEPGSELVVNIG